MGHLQFDSQFKTITKEHEVSESENSKIEL